MERLGNRRRHGDLAWLHAWSGQHWFLDEARALAPQFVACLASVAIAALLHPAAAARTGAGPWAFRTAVLLATLLVTGCALAGLFGVQVTLAYPLGMLLLAAGAWLLAQRRHVDLAALAILALAIDTLIVCGIARAAARLRRRADRPDAAARVDRRRRACRQRHRADAAARCARRCA